MSIEIMIVSALDISCGAPRTRARSTGILSFFVCAHNNNDVIRVGEHGCA